MFLCGLRSHDHDSLLLLRVGIEESPLRSVEWARTRIAIKSYKRPTKMLQIS